jgi:hypothetical protein
MFTGAGGGYATSATYSEVPSTCEFDVVTHAITTAEFQHTYVSARRPVLIRGRQRGKKWDALRESWSKNTIATAHPDVKLSVASIPNAEAYGVVESAQSMFIGEYIEQVMDPAAAAAAAASHQLVDTPPLDDEVPRYIFSRDNSSSLKGAMLTPSFAKDADNIKLMSPQWYLGAVYVGRIT